MRAYGFWALTAACILACAVGVYVAVRLGDPAHGGRGGAIGAALSFGFLFLTSVNSYRSIEKFDAAASELAEMLGVSGNQVAMNARRIHRISQDIKVDVEQQSIQNRFLGASAFVSTLFWGFGDVLANRIIIFLG